MRDVDVNRYELMTVDTHRMREVSSRTYASACDMVGTPVAQKGQTAAMSETLPPDDDRFSRLFADLDAAARAESAHERAGEYGDRVHEELAEVTLPRRIAGALGERVRFRLVTDEVEGTVRAVGENWCLVDAAAGRGDAGGGVGPGAPGVEGEVLALVVLDAVESLILPSVRHAPASAVSRRSLGSVLRELATSRHLVRVVYGLSGSAVEGVLTHVSRDHVQIGRGVAGRAGLVVPIRALVTVRRLG